MQALNTGQTLADAIWFALHVFFAKVTLIEIGPLKLWTPALSSLNWRVVALSALSGLLLLKQHWSIPSVLGAASHTGPHHPVSRDLMRCAASSHSAAPFFWTALLGGSATAALAVDRRSPPLVLEATIPLKAVAGRIDHMAVDLHKHRLVVAELGNDTVEIIELQPRP